LDRDLCAVIGSTTTLVRVQHWYTLKMLGKHHFQPHELPMLENAIEFGCVLTDKPSELTFLLCDPYVTGGWFQASIKTANHGSEVWVKTFFRQRAKEAARKMRRNSVIRPSKW
jgi:hypothetical protein